MGLNGKVLGTYYRIKYQYILKKAVFGSDVSIHCKLVIKGPGKVIFGKGCGIYKSVFYDDFVTLYTYSSKARIFIGDNVILRGTRMGCYDRISIGDHSIIESCSLFDSDFHNIDATIRNENFNQYDQPVVIDKNCYLGIECMVGKGSGIGSDCIVLAKTFVQGKKIRPSGIIYGLPPKYLV